MTADPDGKVEPLPTILIANDQEWAARSLESLLAAEGFRVVRAYTGRQALERLAQTNPQLVVLDVQMPDVDGFEVCRQLRADPRFDATLPVMITTAGPAGRAQRLEAYQAGAWAFHGQPLDAELVLGQIHAFVAAKAAADRVRESALMDPETGLYNRKGLTQRAQELCSEAHRYRGQLACVVMAPEVSLPAPDQGRGAAANGNGNGNGELTALARRIGAMFRRSGRSADAIGRIGRLEFAIVAPQTGATGAEHLVQRFDALLQEARPPESALSAPRLRAGYCAISGIERDGLDAEEMLSRASAALALAEPDSRIRAA